MTFDELANVALVGTGRTAVPTPQAGDDALSRALAATAGGTSEDQLLGAAALLASYETCGRLAPTDDRPIESAPADTRPLCSPRAAALLDLILAMTQTPAKQQLATEWLTAANVAGQRVPHATIPTLLEYGTTSRAIRDAIATVVDQRGRWLMAQNKRWQFASGEDVDLAAIWSTGNREQRASALRRGRETDPAGARALVESTWKEDGADERTAFVEAMQIGLSSGDEPFLERALDDRSKQVRAAVIELLSQLPASAFVDRMVARVAPHVTWKKGTLEVTLPPDAYDATWARDGITEKPDGRVGRRQWWLSQMISAVPPVRWSTLWNRSPAECVNGLGGDFASLLEDAWTTAATRVRDVTWISALIDRAIASKAKEGPSLEHLITAAADLPAGVLARSIASPKFDVTALGSILYQANRGFDAEAATAILAKLDAHARSLKHYDYSLAHVLESAALRLPPEVAMNAAAKWAGDGWDANRTPLESFLQTLQTRLDIRREFTR